MTPKHSLFSSLGRRLGGLFKKETTPEAGPRALSDRGLLAFSHTGDVIRAERLLRQQGFDVEVKLSLIHIEMCIRDRSGSEGQIFSSHILPLCA